ncbi:MAG TPA: hypothetical protein VFS43_31020 [Polyangiaceae bacterium]|nr:hypothetical protein [Polyangiaceae bacterium]
MSARPAPDPSAPRPQGAAPRPPPPAPAAPRPPPPAPAAPRPPPPASAPPGAPRAPRPSALARRSPAFLRLLAPRAALGPLALLAFASAGCAGAPLAEPAYAPHRAVESAWVEVNAPPPPSQPETVPAQPSPRHVWIDGQWVYQRVTSKWTWDHGAWCVPPPDARFYARPVVSRVRRVLGRTTRWNALEGRYEEVDLADDRWSWAKGRFYLGPSRARAWPSDEKGECSAPSTP